MTRAQFQVLIIPYHMASDGKPEYAVTKRSDMDAWQFLSGGGEDHELPIDAARREANEAGGIPRDLEFLQLDSVASIPVHNFSASKEWGEDVYVIPEYSFCVDVGARDLSLSHEHTENRWLPYREAERLLTWDNNRTALWGSQPAHNNEVKTEALNCALHLTRKSLLSAFAFVLLIAVNSEELVEEDGPL